MVDRPIDPAAAGEASRIEEHTEVAALPQVPPDHLAIGRLERIDGVWRVDAGFEPKHVYSRAVR